MQSLHLLNLPLTEYRTLVEPLRVREWNKTSAGQQGKGLENHMILIADLLEMWYFRIVCFGAELFRGILLSMRLSLSMKLLLSLRALLWSASACEHSAVVAAPQPWHE